MTRGPRLWAAVAAADRFSLAARDEIAQRVATAGFAADPGFAVVETCHRVEVYGLESQAAIRSLPADIPILTTDEAARHLCRLACGLESAVVGEDQVLHQVRVTLAGLCERHGDPALIRLFEIAVAAGRRARSGHPPGARDLGELAVRWLDQRGVVGRGNPALVVGSGPMGRLAAAAFARYGSQVTVASRSIDHAAAAAAPVGGQAVSLDESEAAARDARAIVVAMRGRWTADLLAPDRRADLAVVDLSVPQALSAVARAALGDRFADVDRIWRDAPGLATSADPGVAYREVAETIVGETVAAFAAWSSGRPSVETLRALRDRSEEHRASEVQRLLRRLPDLDARERRLVEAFSERLVAALLHAPSTVLRDDVDGSAAVAAERLFRL